MVAVAAVVAKRETVYQNNEVTPGAIYNLALRSIQLGITSTENIGMYLYTSKINRANSLPMII